MENLDYWELYLEQKKLNDTDLFPVIRIETPILPFKVVIYPPQEKITSNHVWLMEQTAINNSHYWRSFDPSNHPCFVDLPWVSAVRRNYNDEEIMEVNEEELHVILDTCTRISKLMAFV